MVFFCLLVKPIVPTNKITQGFTMIQFLKNFLPWETMNWAQKKEKKNKKIKLQHNELNIKKWQLYLCLYMKVKPVNKEQKQKPNSYWEIN